MKQLSVTVLLVFFILLSACKREKDNMINPLILGKWMLDRTVEEDYHPIHTLTGSDEYIGQAGDSVIFLANKTTVTYSDDGDVQEDDYTFLNDSTIQIEYEIYKIRKLTDTECYLHEEEVDQSADEKWVYRIHLKR